MEFKKLQTTSRIRAFRVSRCTGLFLLPSHTAAKLTLTPVVHCVSARMAATPERWRLAPLRRWPCFDQQVNRLSTTRFNKDRLCIHSADKRTSHAHLTHISFHPPLSSINRNHAPAQHTSHRTANQTNTHSQTPSPLSHPLSLLLSRHCERFAAGRAAGRRGDVRQLRNVQRAQLRPHHRLRSE